MIEVKNITKYYQEKEALDEVSFTIEEGKLYGLIGNNGAGKTTLLNILAQQVTTPCGTIYFEGKEMQIEDLQYVSYFMDHSLFNDSDKVSTLLQQYSYFFDDFQVDKVRGILDQMGIQDKDVLKKMSLGERKKCELAFVLSRNAKLFLLDEPFANLDPLVRSELMEMIIRFSHPNASYIISTHQVQEIETYIDATILLKDGKLKEFGDNDELRERYQCSISELLLNVLKEN